MRAPSSIPTFVLPPFTNAAHEALAEQVAGSLRAAPPPEGALAVKEWLRASQLYAQLVPQAWGGAACGHKPESHSVTSLCIVREALGYVSPLADSMFAVHGLGSCAAVLSPGFPDREAFLRKVLRGQSLGAFALTEPNAGSDVASMQTRAVPAADGYALTGEKIYISNGGIADHYLVFANANPDAGKKGISCFLVPAGADGLTVTAMPVSGEHPLGHLRLNACKVPKAALVGEVGHGLRLALGTLDTFRTSVGAAACGMAKRALDEAIAWVRLVEFQLTQAKLADMVTELSAARHLVYRAAYEKDRGESASLEVAMAKMYATEAAQRIIDSAVQLHGGMGVMLGSPVEELYRDIRPLRIYEGTTEIQQLIIGGSLV
jgi:acyl-CoA dehydrogenase